MSSEILNAKDALASSLVMRRSVSEDMRAVGIFACVCRDSLGNVKWMESFPNLVVNQGKNDLLDKYLAGVAWTTGNVYQGLKSTGAPLAADTMLAHATWTQLNITANRATCVFASAVAGSKSLSTPVSHTITAAGPTVVAGVYMVVSGTNGNTNTTGVLFSAGNFVGGNREVFANDVLNVSWSVSV